MPLRAAELSFAIAAGTGGHADCGIGCLTTVCPPQSLVSSWYEADDAMCEIQQIDADCVASKARGVGYREQQRCTWQRQKQLR